MFKHVAWMRYKSDSKTERKKTMLILQFAKLFLILKAVHRGIAATTRYKVYGTLENVECHFQACKY